MPLILARPGETNEAVQLCITAAVRIDFRRRGKHARDESGARQVMIVRLNGGMIVASRNAAHEVVAGERGGPSPYVRAHAPRRLDQSRRQRGTYQEALQQPIAAA